MTFYLICAFVTPIFLSSCEKYLDQKPLINLATPESLNDLQALLDNAARLNESSTCIDEMLTTNFYVTDDVYNNVAIHAASEMQLYIWKDDGLYDYPWSTLYGTSIYYANTVMDALPRVGQKKNTDLQRNLIKGRALFHRAFSFYRLAQLYSKPFSESAKDEPGIVLKLTSNIGEKLTRSTIGESYERILKDIKEAAELLPVSVEFPTCPNKAAAYGLLARVYLSIRDYANAKTYAESCLSERKYLLDYNELVPIGPSPIPQLNAEILFHSTGGLMSFSSGDRNISEELYQLYEDTDLRKEVFFKQTSSGAINFQGSYNGSTGIWKGFDGITTAEIVLVYAECLARENNVEAAMASFNELWIKRCRKNRYTPLTANSASEALEVILKERRKELVGRGIWWSDLRRLNLDGRNISLVRTINNITYQLLANDPKWTLKVPQTVLDLNPALVQNRY